MYIHNTYVGVQVFRSLFFHYPLPLRLKNLLRMLQKVICFVIPLGELKKILFTIHDPHAHKGISNDTIKSPNFTRGHNFVTLAENFCDQMPGLFHQI